MPPSSQARDQPFCFVCVSHRQGHPVNNCGGALLLIAGCEGACQSCFGARLQCVVRVRVVRANVKRSGLAAVAKLASTIARSDWSLHDLGPDPVTAHFLRTLCAVLRGKWRERARRKNTSSSSSSAGCDIGRDEWLMVGLMAMTGRLYDSDVDGVTDGKAGRKGSGCVVRALSRPLRGGFIDTSIFSSIDHRGSSGQT